MLTEEQMKQMDAEVAQRSMGINPDIMPVREEADNYAFTPEATIPEMPMPETYTAPDAPEPSIDMQDNLDYISGMSQQESLQIAAPIGEMAGRFANDVKKTNIYKRYAYSKEDVLREARDISIETGIPESAILYSPQTLDNARNVYNYRRKQMELMPPGTNEVSMDLLTKAYPGLDKIINNGSEVDAAIALHNIQNVKQVNSLVEAARTGWQSGMLRHEMDKIGSKAFMEGRGVTDKEFEAYDKIQKQIEDLRQTPSFIEDPLLSIVGGTAEQVPQQGRGLLTGVLYGTAAAATAAGATVAVAPVTGGASLAGAGAAARWGWGIGMRLGYAVDMWEHSAGGRYIEYSRFKDKDGKRVLTDAEARAYAAAAAAVETGIEFMNAGKILDVLQGNKSAAARQIRDAVAGATDNATFTAALKRVLSGVGEIAVSESLEEGGQEAADRMMSNFVASYKGGNIPKYTPGQVLQGAVESFAEALPASIGFGLSAAGGGTIGLVRKAAAYSELQDLHVRERLKNVTGIRMVQNMIQDAGVKDFFRKDKDIAKQVLRDTVEGTGYEKVNIDTQMVLEQEGGLDALQTVAEAAGMSADEVQKAVETGADITVPTEVYFQVRSENENFAIGENFISFSDTAPCFARNQYYANMVKSELDAVMRDVDARQMEQQQAALDMIVQGNFAEGLEQDAAAAILTVRPDNPAEGWKEMRGMYKQKLDDILAPVIRELKSGIKQGVEIIRVEGGKDGREDSFRRESNNEQWAREFYAENKRWPTQFELEGMAIDILSGRDFSKLMDYQNRPEMEEFYEQNAAEIDEILQNIDVFDAIRDRIEAIDADELQSMEGMSREAYDVYRNVAQQLAASAPNDAVKRSAKAGAALLARRADRFAEAMREAGNANYTATDYFRDRFGLRVGGTFQGGGSNTLFQVPVAERDLVAYHNISEENLMRIAQLGGLPVPSIAVTRKDIPFGQFGKITLIGTSDMIDPARRSNDVFTRDAWTVTFPETVYDPIKTRDVNAFLKPFNDVFDALGREGWREQSEFYYRLTNSGMYGKDDAQRSLYNSLSMQYAFVTKELGKPVKISQKKVTSDYDELLKYKKVRDVIQNSTDDIYTSVEARQKITEEILPFLEKEGDKWVNGREDYLELHLNKNGVLSLNTIERMKQALINYGKTEPDLSAVRKSLNKEIDKPANQSAYEKWIEGHINRMYKNPQIMIGKKKAPITLENIVDAMLKKRGAGEQESLSFGNTKALAAMAKKFGSLDEIRKNKDKLTTSEKAELSAENFKNAAKAYQDAVLPFYAYPRASSWDKLDDANKALVKATKNGGGKTAIKRALASLDFNDVPDDVIVTAQNAIQAAKDVQTDYFEAKPARAVGFNEFAAAVVPNGTSKEAIDFLKSQGIAITKYNPNVAGDRQAKTQKAAQKANVFFQSAFHGTGARFKKFSTDFMGTGEGAQAHGWGLYFAQDRQVAEGYRNQMVYDEIQYRLSQLDPRSKEYSIMQQVLEFTSETLLGTDPDTVIADAEEDGGYDPEAIKRFKENKIGQVFEADVPENNVMLDEQKTLAEREKAGENISKLREALEEMVSDDEDGKLWDYGLGDNVEDENGNPETHLYISNIADENLTGEEIYNTIVQALKESYGLESFEAAKQASLLLNKYGIKGITYDGEVDGRCFVVFDDKAIDILNKFYQRQQRQGDVIQGATEFQDDGRRIVSIFESGNESTMAHELGHIFVADLKELAELPNAPEQIKKDWQTIKDWLGYKDSQKTFTTPQQEKFARGFEAYLRTGEAPATGLRKIFRQFKNWLTKIYKDFLSLGGKPSAEVQAVMGRMLATEQEVENAFKLRETETFEKAGGFDYLAKDSAEMYKRWQEEAREYAKEKVLAQAMKDLTAERSNTLAALRDQMESDIREQMQEQPLYIAEAALTQNPKLAKDWPAEALGMTYEEYTQAIAEQGSLESAVKAAVDAGMQEVEEGMPVSEIKQAAKEAVDSSEYRGLYLAFEQEFIDKKMRRDEALTNRIEKALDDLEKEAYAANIDTVDPDKKIRNQEPKPDNAVKRRIRELKYQARWNEAEMKAMNKLERAEGKRELQQAIREFKAVLNRTRRNVKIYRDTAVEKHKIVKQYAAENMAEMPISEATNVTKWQSLEKRAGRESIEAMKRAIDAELRYKQEESGLVPVNNTAGQAEGIASGTQVATTEALPAKRRAPMSREQVSALWQQANEAKLRQRVFAEYAALAQKNKEFIRKKNARLQARQKTIQKNNNIPANERYMYLHGLYVLGLANQDAQMPQNAQSLMEMVQGYKENLQAFFVDEDGNISMPDYALSAMTGNTVYKDGYSGLTMEQYEYFNDMLTAIYKAGLDANKVKAMKDIDGNTVLVSDVNAAIVDEMSARVPLLNNPDITNAGSPTFAQSIQNKARRARVELTKPETVLDMMGPTAYRYVYETVNQSWNKERVMLEQSAAIMKSIWAPYSNTEKSEMRSKKQYRFGTSILTKEEMICIAFNWGTEINRKRVMDGFGVDEMTVNELLSNMTQKDWQMVTSVWDLVNSYWPETVRVEESMTGVAPKKQSAMPFQITGKDGNVYTLQGGYYPIKYDPSKSLKAANQAQDDAAKQFAANNAAMNRNRSFTKQRVQGTVARPLMLSFNILNRHINDVVHNICFRESLRDVNRIIKSPEVSQAIQERFGIDQARALEQWVRDCWAPDVAKKDVFASSMEFFRHKQTAAALGYRMVTAALNALNIYPMTDYLGATRTMEALGKFYSDPKANWDFALERSIFLRERAETMDRDAGEVLRKEFVGGYGKVADTLIRGEQALERHAFDALAVTDLMLACPLWTAEYQRVYQERTAELKGKMDADAWSRIEMEAVAAGDKAVRTVFGSGEMKDLSPVQKGGEMTKAVTMFYSYFNVVFNALYSGYGEGRREAMGTGSTFNVAPLAKKMLYWIVLTGVTEGLLRSAIDALTGNGGDEPEDWMKAMFKGVSDNIAGTIPVFRDIWSGVIDKLMGERYYGARPLPVYTVYDNVMKLSNTISNDKKSKIDVFREGMRIVNGMTGVGNAVTDAMATTAYWVDTDFDRPLFEYLAAVFFDQRIDRKKKK